VYLMPAFDQGLIHVFVCAHYAINLWVPCVGNDEDFHECAILVILMRLLCCVDI
jgi:hypothetical protein